ncbi:MAG: hypothetical protein IPK58_25145 [Acidobacteria bacterium]|nr:hypothetical protein [Acidobacteriota bacterium]
MREGFGPDRVFPILDNEVFRRPFAMNEESVRTSLCDSIKVIRDHSHRLRPSGLVFEVCADLGRILLIDVRTGTHQAESANSGRFVAVVIKIREVADHMSVFMAERAE